VQADPIRAPARAQDLTLRHRVRGYVAGDLERRYARLPIEEDFFVNYGFVPRTLHLLMHPRAERRPWDAAQWRRARAVRAFIHERGIVHPRDVDAHFAHGKVTNWFGGTSNASTQLLDGMHHRGLLRVARREGGTRLYAWHDACDREPAPADAAMDTLIDVVIAKYAPLPERTLRRFVSWLGAAAVPQWNATRNAAFARARSRVPSEVVDGTRWYWPDGERPASARHAVGDTVRLLAPFDPIVWDRTRFEQFWAWTYRFEAYTPAAKRQLGYYALPLLWREAVIGWANVRRTDDGVHVETGFTAGRAPREAAFRRALEDEVERLRVFLRVQE
jgi:uncharacterized protein YcaQ